MCVCVKHVTVSCCFMSLLLGTSTRASVQLGYIGQVQDHHFSVSFFFFSILEVCIRG